MGTYTMTTLQYAEPTEGPWKLYIFNVDGRTGKSQWFDRKPIGNTSREITAQNAKEQTALAVLERRQVKITDFGDILVFHAVDGKVLHPSDPEAMWRAAGVPEPKSEQVEAAFKNAESAAISSGHLKLSRAEAISTGRCVSCGEPALPKCYSNAGRREYYISGMCEKCFDAIPE